MSEWAAVLGETDARTLEGSGTMANTPDSHNSEPSDRGPEGAVELFFERGEGAAYIAIEREASPEAARIAVAELVRRRAAGEIGPHDMVGIAFKGTQLPDTDTVAVLKPAGVWPVIDNLTDSAVANGRAFLREVEAIMPEARRIADVAAKGIRPLEL